MARLLAPIQDTEDHDGRSTSDDSDANDDDDDNDDQNAGGPVHVPAEEAIVLDDDDVDQECDGPKDPAQELAHPVEPVVPELSSQRMDEVDECPMNGDEVLTGDGGIPLTQEAATSPQQEDNDSNDSQQEESCPTNLMTSFDDADISEDEEEKDAPQKPGSETPKNEDKQDAKHKPVTEKKGWKDLTNTNFPSIPFLEKKIAALRRQQTASLLGSI